jgi:2-isopropylmalate synthase
MDRVVIFDTTLRDGEQSPGFSLSEAEKLDIARQLARLRVDVIEAGFPMSSEADFNTVRRIAGEIDDVVVAGLARAKPGDIDRCWEAVKGAKRPRIHTFISSSDIHLQHQFRLTREQALEVARSMVARAKGYTDDVEFSPMDATRSEVDYLCRMIEAAIDAGATTINVPDTVGYTMPSEFRDLIMAIRQRVPNIDKAIISVHCHNDLGLAVANSLAAVEAGARQIECTVNGIGERAGNAALEEAVMAMKTRSDIYNLTTNVDTTQIVNTSRMVCLYTGVAVQPNKAVVGANAFAHESGIHQDGLLKERTTYEIMDSKEVGVGDSTLVLGKHSGRHALRKRLEDMGYKLSDEELDKTFVLFKSLAEKKKRVGDADLEAIVADEIRVPVGAFKLDYIHVTCGEPGIPTATIRIITPDGKILSDAALGSGPVDATYQAINRLLSIPAQLVDFTINATSEGIDSLGEVSVRLEGPGGSFMGRGADTDIVVASAKAYMNALNRIVAARGEVKEKILPIEQVL